MHRFFIPAPDGYQVDQQIVFPEETAHQLRTVLRMNVGDSVWVLDDRGWKYEVGITAVSRSRTAGQILTKQPAEGEPRVKLTLFQSLTKRDKFEWVLQKGTELGIRIFVPIVTARSLVQDVKIKASKLARWQKIVTEAAEQADRGRIPTVNSPLLFTEAVSQLQAFDLSLIASPAERTDKLQKVLAGPPNIKAVALFIGPEGGFTAEELVLGRSQGLRPFTLGARILRTETAAIVSSALILHELGELA